MAWFNGRKGSYVEKLCGMDVAGAHDERSQTHKRHLAIALLGYIFKHMGVILPNGLCASALKKP